MKILITGITGQVGRALTQVVPALGTVIPLDRHALDLSQTDHIEAVVRGLAPDLIVHPAAYTAVDRAEEDVELCHTINAEASGALGRAARALNIPIIAYSTDYVFDGQGSAPHLETDPTGPINVYGASKLAGEEAIRSSGAEFLILRTSWVYGLYGKNFLLTMLKLAETREEIGVVADQIGAPSESVWIAETTRRLIERCVEQDAKGTRLNVPSGIIHLAPRGETSWAGFAQAIFALKSLPTRVREISTEDYPTPARRPKNSRLDIHKLEALLDLPMPHWRVILERCLHHLPRFPE